MDQTVERSGRRGCDGGDDHQQSCNKIEAFLGKLESLYGVNDALEITISRRMACERFYCQRF